MPLNNSTYNQMHQLLDEEVIQAYIIGNIP